MDTEFQAQIEAVCASHGNKPIRLLDIARSVQDRYRCVSQDAIDVIALELGVPRIDVESVVSFYSYLSVEPKGKVTIRLSDSVVDKMAGAEEVAEALSDELGIGFGEVTADGAFSLERTSCIGMSDQAPAALVNDVVATGLSPDRARALIAELREHGDPSRLVSPLGDGNNAHELVRSVVRNNIRRKDRVLLAPTEPGVALRRALAMNPAEVIRTVKTARLRGRGGAGFPAGIKWEFTRSALGDRKFIVCNADEGEPGTFKDRVLLTECPELIFEGMTVAGYAIGAADGIVYLRAEYAYLQPFLEHVLNYMRETGRLGRLLLEATGLDFDIRIQMGAGAYVCGEETALINSLEGQRGDPKTRPPFPAQRGYLGYPTAVNNVETLCCAARILAEGAGWFSRLGSGDSTGTKLLSISGDCLCPGVYEIPLGITLREVLQQAGGGGAQAVQVGGPSGRLVGRADFDRRICFDDLATGGSIMVFSADRNLIAIVADFLRFFVHESCGYCTPCRVGNALLLERVERFLVGACEPSDIEYLRELGETIRATSRCGLGQTSPNPILTALDSFPEVFAESAGKPSELAQPGFDIRAALATSERLTGRDSVHFSGSDGTNT